MDEQWKPIPDFSGYEVSNMGRMRSWLHGGRGGILKTPHTLIPRAALDGRLRISLRKDGRTFSASIHRLVLLAFVGPCPDGMQACHYDDDCTNNILDNLRWDTMQSNLADQARNGKVLRGERNGQALLTEEQIVEIRERYARRERTVDIAKMFGIARLTVNDIARGDVWKHVGGPITRRGKRIVTHSSS